MVKVKLKPKNSDQKDHAKEVITDSRKARLALKNYMNKHNLDPNKDYSKDKVHGPVISKYQKVINVGMRMNDKLRKPNVHPKVNTVKSTPTNYDYPDIDGQPMSSTLKKKYRTKMRALLKANMSEEAAKRKALERLQGFISKAKEEAKSDLDQKQEKVNKKPESKVKKVKLVKKIKKVKKDREED